MHAKKAIQVFEITKNYPGIKALDKISFEVEQGTIHGFLGPNGAGKSTAINIISGLLPPTQGEVFLRGSTGNYSIVKNRKQAKALVGLLPENPPLYSNMIVKDYLKFVQDIYLSDSRLKKKDPPLSKIIERCGLLGMEKRLIGNLSKGYKQRIGLAQALVYKTDILILDEPMVGLDPIATAALRDLIFELKEDHTILFSGHQLHEVSLLCSHVTIINKGKIIQTGTLKQVQKNYQEGIHLTFCLERWPKKVQQELEERFGVSEVSVHKKRESLQIRMRAPAGNENKIAIGQLMVEKGLGLSEMEEEKIALEDIFKQAIKPEKNDMKEGLL